MFRELYSEKRVVFEERRMRVDDSPMGKFQESFAAQAMTNNYRRPVIGYPADLALLGRREVQAFFNQHYGPQRLSVAVVGDVEVDRVRQAVELSFLLVPMCSSCPQLCLVAGDVGCLGARGFCEGLLANQTFYSSCIL